MAAILSFLQGNETTIVSVLVFLFGVAKVSSTSNSGVIISKVQAVFDGLAKGLQIAADVLASVIKSDGFLGKK